MRLILFVISIILLSSCSKQRTVLICGDHVCVNKMEAEQYFEENLTIEVKIIDEKVKEEINLVELNLNKDQTGNRKVTISSKKNINKSLKTLSNKEIVNIKKNIKDKQRVKKSVKKIVMKTNQPKTQDKRKNKIIKNSTNNVDVCKILAKCNIEQISKYLLQQGKKKDFPDITIKQ